MRAILRVQDLDLFDPGKVEVVWLRVSTDIARNFSEIDAGPSRSICHNRDRPWGAARTKCVFSDTRQVSVIGRSALVITDDHYWQLRPGLPPFVP